MGLVGNPSNVKRFAMRHGISQPFMLSREELVAGYKACKQRRKELEAVAPMLRREHLRRCLSTAYDKGEEQHAKRLKEIMARENFSTNWRRIKAVTQEPCGGNVTRVDIEINGDVISCADQESVQQAIQENLSERFYLANSSPFCQGYFLEQLGTLADFDIAVRITTGDYVPPPDMDEATLLILEEIANVGMQIQVGAVTIIVTPEDFKYYWQRVNERTSSSYSGLHFGHYKAAAESDYLSRLHALHITTIARSGCHPKRWGRGLTVMLEKIAGCALVHKLRAILLMEADFNFHNKLVFGHRMMDMAREKGLIPPEVYSQKESTTEDAILDHVLSMDLAEQARVPFLDSSVDAANCYDRMAHNPTALCIF